MSQKVSGRWSKQDFDNCHADFNNGMSIKELAVKYNRRENAVAKQLNRRFFCSVTVKDTAETITIKNNNIVETNDDDNNKNYFQMKEIVEEYTKGKTINELITQYGLDEHIILHCLLQNIQSKIPKNKNITRPNNQKWTKKEINSLLDNKHLSILEISNVLKNRTCHSIVRQQILLHICPLFNKDE